MINKDNKTNRTRKSAILKSGKNKLISLIFGRSGLIVLALAVQAILLIAVFVWFSKYSQLFISLVLLLTFIMIIYIHNAEIDASFKLAWMLPIIIFPIFGTLLFAFFSFQKLPGFAKKHLDYISLRRKKYLLQNKSVEEKLREDNKRVANLSKYLYEYADAPVYFCDECEYFKLGEDAFEKMKEKLRKAKHFIFLEYFIIEHGKMWDSILEILIQKAKEGVEVRVMYDGTCSFKLLPHNYPKQLEALGIKCKVFSPIKPLLSIYQNYRDHRKIMVIDGEYAFTGGINMADEYINETHKLGHFKDTAVMISGKGVTSFTMIFLELWNIDTKLEDLSQYAITCEQKYKKGYIIPYSDKPLGNENVAENIIMDMLYNAKSYIHITTPYLTLDDDMLTAIRYAAKRGVETVIVLPAHSDSFFNQVLAYDYLPELLEAGVKIYEYTPGFIHAKNIVSDDEFAMVSSVNLDFRSLYLNYESGLYMYGCNAVSNIEKDFQDILSVSKKITIKDYKNTSVFKRILGFVLKLIAPLM